MSTTISFFVPGTPKPQPRARSFVLRGKGGRPILSKTGQPILRVHEEGSAENWKAQIALVAKEFVPMPPLQGPLRVDIDFYFPRPEAHYKSQSPAARAAGAAKLLKESAPFWFCNKREDRDNLDKAVLDTLTVLGMWSDDGQVCDGRIRRMWSGFVHPPGAQITIEQLAEPAQLRSKPEPAELSLSPL